MGKVIVVIILYVFLSALLRLESELIVAACRDASVIRGIFDTNSENSEFVSSFEFRFRVSVPSFDTNAENSEFVSKIPLIILASRHDATISLDSSLKRANRNTNKMMTTITLPICNLIHL
jgi:hypothetical protein